MKDFIIKHIKCILFSLLIVLYLIILIFYNFELFLSTVLVGALVGLCTSYTITYMFEKDKINNRNKIKKLTLDSFVYSCASYLIQLEEWYKQYTSNECNIISDPQPMLDLLQKLRDDYKSFPTSELPDEYSSLVSEYIYSIAPVYSSFLNLDNLELLLSETVTPDEYKFFHNIIRIDIFKNYFSNKSVDRFGEKCDSSYIFQHLRICLNCVIDAIQIFNDITTKYEELKKREQ